MDRIQEAIQRLIHNEPLYGLFLRYFNTRATTQISTAGVHYDTKKKQIELLYNLDFMSAQSQNAVCEILKHEALHVIFKHTDVPTTAENANRINIAMDLDINCYLDEEIITSAGGVHPNRLGMPFGLHWKQYLELLPEDPEQQSDCLSPGDGEEGSAVFSEDISILAESLLRETKKEMRRRGIRQGTGNQKINELVDALYGETVVDWKSVLRSVVKKVRSNTVNTTIKRQNKRFKHSPGITRQYKTKVLVAVDESGSVSDNLWTGLVEALSGLEKHTEFFVVPFTDELHEEALSPGLEYKQRHYMGGTDFDAPTKFFNDNRKYDALIILTDGEASTPQPCRGTRVWLLPKGASGPVPGEQSVEVISND